MTIKAVVTLESDSIDNADDVTNTFAIGGSFDPQTMDLTEEAELNAAFEAFYNTVPVGGTLKISQWLSPVLLSGTNVARLDLYDISAHLDGSNHGSPFSSTLFDLGASNTVNGLPSEVCVCVTLEGEGRADAPVEVPDSGDSGLQVDRPKQRHTGRLFIGPLNTDVPVAVSGIMRPQTAFLQDLRFAVRDLDAAIRATTLETAHLGVWSRKNATIYELEAVSTDNAFDTQRRRGEAPSVRTRLALNA